MKYDFNEQHIESEGVVVFPCTLFAHMRNEGVKFDHLKGFCVAILHDSKHRQVHIKTFKITEKFTFNDH